MKDQDYNNPNTSIMLMYAKATLTADITDANPGSTTLLPGLTFRHFSPLVRFRVRNASNTPWRVTKIEMLHSTETNNAKWFATAATCNLTAADNAAILSSIALSTEPANRSRSITLNVVNGKELPTATTAFAPGNHLNAYIALLPTVAYTTEEAAAGDYINICITLSSTNPAAATKELIYKVPYKDVEFLRNGLKSGLRYSFSFSIKTEEVELDGLDIAPWNNATGDGDLDWE